MTGQCLDAMLMMMCNYFLAADSELMFTLLPVYGVDHVGLNKVQAAP